MAYMQELDAWLDGLFTELADQNITFAETKKAIREKVLTSYRNGQKAFELVNLAEKAEGQSTAPQPKKSRGGKKQAQRFTGNWQCSKCGRTITSLPFQPRGASVERLQCLDCYNSGTNAKAT